MRKNVFLLCLLVCVNIQAQQQQWIDIGQFTPSLKSCYVLFDENFVYFDVFTQSEEIRFALPEPARSATWQCLGQNLDIVSKQELMDNLIIGYLQYLPANAQIIPYSSGKNTLPMEDSEGSSETAQTNPVNSKNGIAGNNLPQQQQQNTSDSSSEDGWSWETILFIIFGFWLCGKLIGAIFGSGKKKSDSEKFYEDASWFHDHKK